MGKRRFPTETAVTAKKTEWHSALKEKEAALTREKDLKADAETDATTETAPEATTETAPEVTAEAGAPEVTGEAGAPEVTPEAGAPEVTGEAGAPETAGKAPNYHPAVSPVEADPKQSDSEEKDLEGHTMTGAKTPDGHWHGEVKHVDAEGNHRKTSNFKNGELWGPQTHLHANGAIGLEQTMKNGRLQGKQTESNAQGETLSEKHFHKGKQVGDAHEYHDSGKLKSHSHYENGEEQGRISFDEEGDVTSKGGSLKDAKIKKAPEHAPHNLGDARKELPQLSDSAQAAQNRSLHQQHTFKDHAHYSHHDDAKAELDHFTRRITDGDKKGDVEVISSRDGDVTKREVKGSDGKVFGEVLLPPGGHEIDKLLNKDGSAAVLLFR